MNQIQSRIGSFTSSEIVALTTKGKSEMFGAAAKNYIQETNMERRLGRSISADTNARPLSWGKLLERRCFDLLGLEYQLSSAETVVHPKIPYWAGSADGFKYDEGKTVIDIKNPISLKSFCEFADCKTIDEVRENHKDGEKYFWQLISNAILSDCKFAELIIHCPYKSELSAIREMANNYTGNANHVAWINFSTDEELPYILDGGFYKNINIIRWEISSADKEFLTSRVLEAGKLLIKI